MHNRMRKLALMSLAGMLAAGLVALVWAIGIGSSEAQQGAMQNCPQAGKWAISVWSGDDGTATEQGLATCGAGAVAAAYWLDPQTQEWSRYFQGRPEMSSLAALNDMQGVIALGVVCSPLPTAAGTVTHRYEPPATFPDPSTLPTADCWVQSLSTGRADAFRCMSNHSIYDPCFLNTESMILACPVDPRDESTTTFLRWGEQSGDPADVPRGPGREESAWFVVLDAPGNPACKLVTGATGLLPRGRADFPCVGWCVSPGLTGSGDLVTYCYPGVQADWSEEEMLAVEIACGVSEAWQ